MPRPFPDSADRRELERRYRLEKRLADRLRRATAEERAGLYSEVYGEYARGVGGLEDDPGSLALQRRLLAPWLTPGVQIVEIGAGSGATARGLLGEGRRVVAIEAVMPEDAETSPGVEWIGHDEAREEIGAGSIDLAYSCHVIEHLHPDDLPDHFRDVLGWLRPGGAYLMVTPNRLHGPHDISAYFSDRPEGFHLREYSHRDLASEARRAGFDSISAVDPAGRIRPLWTRALMEILLGLCGAGLRRRLFDGVPAMRRRAPLRPLEQVVLAAFRAET